MNRREAQDLDRYLTRSDEPADCDDGWLDHHARQSVDDLVDRYGFARARDMLAEMLTSRAGSRPVIIDHIQEPH